MEMLNDVMVLNGTVRACCARSREQCTCHDGDGHIHNQRQGLLGIPEVDYESQASSSLVENAATTSGAFDWEAFYESAASPTFGGGDANRSEAGEMVHNRKPGRPTPLGIPEIDYESVASPTFSQS